MTYRPQEPFHLARPRTPSCHWRRGTARRSGVRANDRRTSQPAPPTMATVRPPPEEERRPNLSVSSSPPTHQMAELARPHRRGRLFALIAALTVAATIGLQRHTLLGALGHVG